MPTLFILAQEVPPIDGAWLQYGPVWGTVGFLLLIVVGLVYARIRGNGSGGKREAAELGPVIAGAVREGMSPLTSEVQRCTEAMVELRVSLAGMQGEFKQAMQALPARRRAASK